MGFEQAAIELQRVKRQRQELILRVLILSLVFVVAFATRLFSVLRFESVIHEFDPYFNFRSTKYLVDNGFYDFLNWFDDSVWYPLGRVTGGTVYPGLMITAASIYNVLEFFHLHMEIRNVCVFLAPFFASLTSLSCYFMGKEARNTGTGLVAAAFVAIVPGYISRSVAGSFDNEGIAIFALIFTYALWIKSVKTGSLFWSSMCAIAYFYMVAAWGGYIFIINLIPLYVFIMLISGRYSPRLYIAYCSFYVTGTLFAMQIKFVGFQAVQSSEHMAAMGMFGLLQIVYFIDYFRSQISEAQFKAFKRMFFFFVLTVGGSIITLGFITGYVTPWTGRFYNLLDPTYAKEHIPIIASVSEHQPTTWSSFFFDLHVLVFLFPAGLYFCFQESSGSSSTATATATATTTTSSTTTETTDCKDGLVFLICYGITSVYFAGVMVRLMLVLAPIACVVSAVAVSATLERYMAYIKTPTEHLPKGVPQREISITMVFGMTLLLTFYVMHCTWVTSEAYSSPSIVLAAKQPDGSRLIFDDFRESYYWLRSATHPDAKVMSWWDYGYQLSAMANRTIFVDNNTWNNSHIAQVGKAFAVGEEDGARILRNLAGDDGGEVYVLVLFGGLSGYSSEDFSKFPWMIRIAGSTDPNIKEADYLTKDGQFAVDARAPPATLNSLMYKLLFYRFGQVYTDRGKPPGWDRVRNAEIGNKDFELKYFEEAFTSQHWLVRIYRLLPPANRDPNAVGEFLASY